MILVNTSATEVLLHVEPDADSDADTNALIAERELKYAEYLRELKYAEYLQDKKIIAYFDEVISEIKAKAVRAQEMSYQEIRAYFADVDSKVDAETQAYIMRAKEMKAEQIRAYFAKVISEVKADKEAYIVRTKELKK